MSVDVKVSGVRKNFQNFRLSVELGLGESGKRARGYLFVDTGAFATAKPETGEPFEIEVNGATEFKGSVVRVTDEWINPVSYEATIEAVDFLPLLNSHLVTCELAAGSLSWQVNRILSEFCDGFTLGIVDSNPSLPAQTIYYSAAAEVFRDLAEQTDQVFELDFDKQVHFYQTSGVAPILTFVVEDEDRVSSFIVTEDWSNLFNVLILTGVTIRTPYAFEEMFLGDGYRSVLNLSWQPWSVSDVTVAISKNSGGTWTDKTCLLDPLDLLSAYELTGDETEAEQIADQLDLEQQRQRYLLGSAGEVYISIANSTVRFPTADPLREGELVRARYYVRRTDQVLMSRNETSITALAAKDGTDGVREKRMSLPALQASNLASATNYAEMLLARGAWPIVHGSFESYVTGWLPAQRCTISSVVREVEDPQTGGPIDAWITQVAKRYPAVEDGTDFKIHHTIEFADNPYGLPGLLDRIIHRIMVDPLPPVPIPFTTSTSTTTTSTSTTMTSTTTTLLPDNWCQNDSVLYFPDRSNIPVDETQFVRIVACTTGYITDARVYVRAANAGTLRLGVYDDAGDGDTPDVLRGEGTVTPGYVGYARVRLNYINFPVNVYDIIWLAIQNSVAGTGGHQLASRETPEAIVYNKETELYGYADGLPGNAGVTTLDPDEVYYGAVWVDAIPYTSTSTTTTSTSTTTTSTSTSTTMTATSTSTTTISTTSTSTSTTTITTTTTSTTSTTVTVTSTSTTYLPGAILLEASTPNP